jgi:Ca-activated chloride channel family protein
VTSLGEVQIGNPNYQLLAWLIVPCFGAAIYAVAWRRRARSSLATPSRLPLILSDARQRRTAVRPFLVLLSIMLLGLAAMDLRWGKVTREVPQSGIEVVFALDVSRSMLAQDVAPDRLGRAKQMIIDTMSEMAGDAVGLVLFAGESRQAIPVTSHYEEFRQRIDDVSPMDIYRGGSRLGDAIRVARKAFLNESTSSKAIVLLTDGEDMESDPVEAARTAFEEDGIRVFTIGLGDREQGSPIPITSRSGQKYVQHRGETVQSKLDGRVLQQIADASGGDYIPAGTKQVNMADFYAGYLDPLPDSVTETQSVDNYEARFQWFLAPAIGLLMLEIFLSGHRRD